MMNPPPIPASVLRYLKSVFPDTAVDPNTTDPAVHYGSVKVVRHLEEIARQQEEEPTHVREYT